MAEKTLAALSIPVVSELYGPVYTGSMVLVEAALEAAPNLLAASIVAEASAEGTVGLIIYRDYVQNYYMLLESLGIPVDRLVGEGRLVLMEVGRPEDLGPRLSEAASRFKTVVVYAVGLDELGWEAALEIIGKIRESAAVTYFIVDPGMLGRDTLILERLSDVVFKAVVREMDKGYSRRLIMVYSKRRARPDISVHYTVSASGVSFESLSRM